MINYAEYIKLTEGERALVDWQYVNTGCFSNQLMDLIMKADTLNLIKLERAFPSHVEAYKKYAHHNGWWQSIQVRIIRAPLYEVPID